MASMNIVFWMTAIRLNTITHHAGIIYDVQRREARGSYYFVPDRTNVN